MVKNYRKKPVVIQALAFDGTNFDEVIGFTKGNAIKRDALGGSDNGSWPKVYTSISITTMHQGQKVDLVAGDFVIPEPDGVNFYPCKESVFKETYELV